MERVCAPSMARGIQYTVGRLVPQPELFLRMVTVRVPGKQGVGCNWSGCNVRMRLQLRLLPTAFIAYCPLFEPMPMSADRPHSQCFVCSLPALSLVISTFTVRSGPLDSWTLSGQACIPVSGQPHVMHADCWPRSARTTLDACWTLGLRTQWARAVVWGLRYTTYNIQGEGLCFRGVKYMEHAVLHDIVDSVSAMDSVSESPAIQLSDDGVIILSSA